MGKKQHQKDKLYLTNKEWREEWGGKKADVPEKASFRRLPFYCCSLSMQPFEHPLCTKDGVIFDLLNIVPYLKKFGKSPVTGEPLQVKELVKLNFHKNAEDKYHCPVTFKVFNNNSHIVAVKPTGNVFSYDAVEQLNLKAKNFKDLLTDEPFTRKDIITIQNNLKVVNEEEEKAKKDPKYYLNRANKDTLSILSELEKTYKEPEKKTAKKTESLTERNAAHYSTGAVASSFTSTAQIPVTQQEAAIVDQDTVRYREVKKKGYVRLQTSHGDLNLELHCEMVTKTCENFIKLCSSGYYDNTIFHRSIRNFMIQGGDPTGTGRGGESAWGEPFKDEFKPNLIHQGRGILSMANSGPSTNKSQFFITYRSCRHLDEKHSVFGRLVGGLETLSAMERVEEVIKLIKAVVFTNPFEEVDTVLKEEREKREEEEKRQEEAARKKKAAAAPVEAPKVYRSGIGKYIPQKSSASRDADAADLTPQPTKKKIKTSGGFKDFSSW
ncbi:RING-type E3 ubiquitin-protein ligase ppil2 [Desmophyllum pertusum]|uniref:RING-type E3 ubiquitin-protein ligase PPIL2 n=1 Tax=Desmophyllum pertusum TaxID=174260 RepID=A0A9W9ZIF6_9CNID|nr:RING-type E3 ubiquitin-protein ligase ppil2 [Desmophyllum pertusum]